MKKLLTAFASAAYITSLFVVTLFVVAFAAPQFVAPAAAGDLQQPYARSSAVVSPNIWSGFYMGALAGYGWSGSVPVGGFVDLGSKLQGGFLGGNIGYNWQAPDSHLVWGAQVEGSWSDAHFGAFGPLGNFQDRLRAFGSATGRLGWATGTTLLYVKGGLGWADNKASAGTLPPLVGAQAESNGHLGWTIGTGLEYMFAPAWSAKAEYMYADYGHKSYFNNIVDIGITTHTVKTGIDYHFNWGGPVVTRY